MRSNRAIASPYLSGLILTANMTLSKARPGVPDPRKGLLCFHSTPFFSVQTLHMHSNPAVSSLRADKVVSAAARNAIMGEDRPTTIRRPDHHAHRKPHARAGSGPVSVTWRRWSGASPGEPPS